MSTSADSKTTGKRPFVIGLTGSIGMGKSTVAAMFAKAGIPVHDADATVHALYAGAAVPLVEAAFAGVSVAGVVVRGLLSARLAQDPASMKTLEAIVHPLVHQAEADFLARAAASGAAIVLLDIPLLFETGGENRMDLVLVASAPEAVQRQRVLARPGMTPERFAAIVARQMSDAEKSRRADIVIDTATTLAQTADQVQQILRRIMSGEFHARDRAGHGNNGA
jgi:dephospho-CoA kinase